MGVVGADRDSGHAGVRDVSIVEILRVTAIHRSALVPYSAREMFELVADIPSYPKFLPWCAAARVLSREAEDAVIASIDIDYHGVHKTFTTRNLLQRDKAMEIRLLDGPFSFLQGFWNFAA